MQDRLLHLLKSFEISKKDFAEKIGLSPSIISDYFNGRLKSLSADAVVAIYKEFNVNPAWLLTGEGEMFLPDNLSVLPFAQNPDHLSRIVKALPENEREAIRDFVEYRAARAGVDTSKIKEPVVAYKTIEGDSRKMPLFGRIAAGIPMLAEESIERRLSVPDAFLPRRKNAFFFALMVRVIP